MFYDRNNLLSHTQSADGLLLEKHKAQLDLYRQFAHDIAAPIECLKACITYLENVPPEFKALMDSALERAGDMMSQLKQAHQELKQEPGTNATEHLTRIVNLSQIAQNIISEKAMQLKSSSCKIVLHSNIESDLMTVANPIEMARVLSNLINNAVEAMKDQRTGTVTVVLGNRHEPCITCHAIEEIPFSCTHDACRTVHDAIQITISDTGPGIAPDVLPRLMQQGATFGKQNGSGLGLYHAKKSIESWGGWITIESLLGVGTKVKILLTATVA